MKWLYTSIYFLFITLAFPFFIYRILFRGKYRKSLYGIMGFQKPRQNPGVRPTFWIHAVSVGEVNAAAAVEREIRTVYTDARIVISTITETGQAHARESLGGKVDDIFYFPMDVPWLVNRFLDRVQPTHFIMMETELWPNMLLSARQRGIKIYMMNGKLSPKSFRRYMAFRWLFRKPLDGVSAFCMQTRIDGSRMARLSGRKEAVHVTGNCKFDTPMEPLRDEERNKFYRQWHIRKGRPVVVIGSTHPREEEIIIDAFEQVRRDLPDTAFVLAPRHPERFNEVFDLLKRRGLNVLRVSISNGGPPDPDIVLIDQIGILRQAYGAGDVAIVAGSFVPIGGHNLLEAAVHRIPVLYGPHMHKQQEILRIFEEFNGGLQVDADQLGSTVLQILKDREYRMELGRRAFDTVKMSKGTAERNVRILTECESGEHAK